MHRRFLDNSVAMSDRNIICCPPRQRRKSMEPPPRMELISPPKNKLSEIQRKLGIFLKNEFLNPFRCTYKNHYVSKKELCVCTYNIEQNFRNDLANRDNEKNYGAPRQRRKSMEQWEEMNLKTSPQKNLV